MKQHLRILLIILILPSSLFAKNKLLEMLKFYYLPFNIDLEVGESKDEILPSRNGHLLSPEEMQRVEKNLTNFRQEWKSKSLLNGSQVELNQQQKISPHLMLHRIASTRGAVDTLPLEGRTRLKDLLNGKSKEIQSAVLQKQFVRSFIDPNDSEKVHFFIVAPNWCASSETYRMILEAYTKKFALGKFVLHSVIIEDSKEEIFDTRAMNELFPFSKKYSHESVPRFLMTETMNQDLIIYEEEVALKEFNDRFFSKSKGFQDQDFPRLPKVAQE